MLEKNDTVILLGKICDLFELTFVNDEIKYSKLGKLTSQKKKIPKLFQRNSHFFLMDIKNQNDTI